MELCFHDRFYKPQPYISVSDLMNIKQSTNELVVDFLERLKRMKSKCNVQLSKLEYATIIVGNITA